MSSTYVPSGPSPRAAGEAATIVHGADVAPPRPLAGPRPVVRGKFLFCGEHKLLLKGATYGPFRPDAAGNEYGARDQVQRDFAAMAAAGLNAVRTYTVPQRWLLDEAAAHGLRVMVGVPWEQHVAFLDSARICDRIRGVVRDTARQCADHPALLAYTIGNEIPPSIVRWHGRRRVERFLRGLYDIVKTEDPESLVSYVNFPTTEYLQLPFLDFACFNVFLEERERLEAYLARLQNNADDKPLVMTEVGLDSMRNGEAEQAESLRWQLRATFAAGCAGTFVFSWTDEWHRSGVDIDDWAFGMTDRQRAPKPALEAVRDEFADAPFGDIAAWPKVSVVVCTYNGSVTIRECLEGLTKLEYPDYEVIVVNDGSNDRTREIIDSFPFRSVTVPNGGLSKARNIGLDAATGEIVAYIDDDAYPDPHWLHYLVHTFMTTGFVGVGGPNLLPAGDGPTAECVANAPGGPNHVLLTDRIAEHIPGCNMAFRRDALQSVGGFDEQFRIAGDDVDLCWRLQQAGGELGFSAAAVVWHHRRRSIRTYLRQQRNYGAAEAMLEMKWPEKFNGLGHVTWTGRLYGCGPTVPLFLRRYRVYHGVWGSRLFQPMYAQAAGPLRSLPLLPEWLFITLGLAGLTVLGLIWPALLIAAPLLAVAVGATLTQAAQSALQARLRSPSRRQRLRQRLVIMWLHMAQPLVRLIGRLTRGLTPWRRRMAGCAAVPRRMRGEFWSEQWQAPEQWLEQLEGAVRRNHGVCVRGGSFDRWDLELRGGLLGAVRMRLGIEEHGQGRQQALIAAWPRVRGVALVAIGITVAGGAVALGQSAGWAALGAGLALLATVAWAWRDCAAATGGLQSATSDVFE